MERLMLPSIPEYAQKSFNESYLRADRVILVLMLLQWLTATLITSLAYDTYGYGFVAGGLITLTLFGAYRLFAGTKMMRVLAGIAMMLFSLVFIQQHLGRIEMHFHVFIALAILSLYKELAPLLAAAATTIIHHVLFNYLQLYEVSLFGMPVMIFNYGCGFDIVVLHAIFVLVETAVIGYIIRLQMEYAIELNRSEKKILGLNEVLSHSATHDTLTGLPNRDYLHAKLDWTLSHAKRYRQKFALLFLDLDHFKNINDTLGHDVGDALLIQVASRLQALIRENDIVARIGGDEFIIVITDLHGIQTLEAVMQKILEAFRQEWRVEVHSLRLSISIGSAIYPDDARNLGELMKFADIAMYRAKAQGRDQFCFFTTSLNAQIHHEMEIANTMHKAMEDREFVLHFQPKVALRSGVIIGGEALIRWNHPQRGVIYPGEFIRIAENTGFILILGAWVIDETVAALGRLAALGYEDIHISCNISMRQFRHKHLVVQIEEALKRYRVRPQTLAIEITESVMMEQMEVTLELLRRIKSSGVHVCMDDFGTGYSSLSYLRQLPIDSLKIDKSFVDDIKETGDNSRLLLNTILVMGRTLGLHVVAEGVEREAQRAYLEAMECDYYQGFLCSRAVAESEFTALLAANRSIS
ncbi:MAG: EAL domain-containing protein [Campylobacterales bacterium]|nr:EAL domain-containing protein [Campylobacterales bacterium]